MNKFLIGFMALISASSFSSECTVIVKGYRFNMARYVEPTVSLITSTLSLKTLADVSMIECLETAKADKFEFQSVPDAGVMRTVFTKVVVNYVSETESLSAELK